jgi:radical SAM protein with 4Fe4S-binding SPASM domain
LKTKLEKIARLIARRNKAWWKAGLNYASMLAGTTYAPCLPVHLTIEPASVCNLQCPVCETGNRTLTRPQGLMSMEIYRAVVDKMHRHINTVLLYFMGEPFLNPALYEMIRYARTKRIYVCICTNGEYVEAHKLIDTGVNEISFQISGVSDRTHQEYRRGAVLSRTLNNVTQLVQLRKKNNALDMSIELGMIVMKHNEHEVGAFKELAARLEVDRLHLIRPRVRSLAQAKDFLPNEKEYWLYDGNLYNRGVLSPQHHRWVSRQCFWLWNSTVITWNGDVVPCCNDVHGDHVMGNILREDMASIWNNDLYRRLRGAVLHHKQSVSLCGHCVE